LIDSIYVLIYIYIINYETYDRIKLQHKEINQDNDKIMKPFFIEELFSGLFKTTSFRNFDLYHEKKSLIFTQVHYQRCLVVYGWV
jgi:hypothetical protein